MKCIVLKLGCLTIMFIQELITQLSVLKLSWRLPLNTCPGFQSPRYSQQLVVYYSKAACIGFPYSLCIVYVRSGLLWLHLIPSQHSRGLSGRRKPICELAEPLEWILEIENRALTQLTHSQKLHNTAQDQDLQLSLHFLAEILHDSVILQYLVELSVTVSYPV